MKVTFTVPGPPIPKSTVKGTAGGHYYIPGRTRDYMNLVKLHGTAALGRRRWPKDKLYSLRLLMFFPDFKTRDSDNVLKGAKDALTGVLWDDDKWWAFGSEHMEAKLDRKNPRLEVEVEIVGERGKPNRKSV